MRLVLMLMAAILSVMACSSDDRSTDAGALLQPALEELQRQHTEVPGFAVALLDDGTWGLAGTGDADPAGTPMTAETPVRIASITKTFVAATALRLWEDGQLDLDAPINSLLSAEIDGLLTSDGYDTNSITVRHLLMHAAGMADHVGDAYIEQVLADPTKAWTPAEQIDFLVTTTDPIGTPGDQFEYSDTGYVVLGEILKEVTGLPLHQTAREQLKLDQLDLPSLHWDEAEPPRAAAPARAHQRSNGQDIYGLHGSMDGHGGGGIVASIKDVATFYTALFNGEIFNDPATLGLMTTAPGHPPDSPYRYGLFTFDVAGEEAFHHGGFWGTYVTHVPTLNLTIAGVALDRQGYDDLRALMNETIADRAKE